jgi:hypothetical protein
LTRTFLHSFDPLAASPVAGPTVDLDVSDIEDAGIREVLQTPGTAYGAWSILDTLLTPTGAATPFIFKEPLDKHEKSKSPSPACLDASSLAPISSVTSISRSSPISAAERSTSIAVERSRSKFPIKPGGKQFSPIAGGDGSDGDADQGRLEIRLGDTDSLAGEFAVVYRVARADEGPPVGEPPRRTGPRPPRSQNLPARYHRRCWQFGLGEASTWRELEACSIVDSGRK